MSGRRLLYLALILAALLVTRLPFAPGQIFSFDDVNLTYAADEFDIHKSQPQPPGYPLFVMQQRVSRVLGFKNPVSNLVWLAMAGSFATLLAVLWSGRLILSHRAGHYALWLLLVHPAFWYTTLTSALRVQLALISALVAGACWRAWKGETRWNYIGAIALGLGAGVRPELGPLLFPLWLASLLKSGAGARASAAALGTLAASVLVWLVPLVWTSGGPANFVNACLTYLGGQDTLQGEVLDVAWRTTAVWFVVWTFSGWLLLPILTRLGRGAARLSREQTAFFVLWMLPGIVFALLVHVADPGHTLAVLVPVTFLVAHQVDRAVEARLLTAPSKWDAVFPLVLLAPVVVFPFWFPADIRSLMLVSSMLCLMLIPRAMGTALPTVAAAGFMLVPALNWSAYLFASKGWFHQSPGHFSVGELRSQADSGITLSSLDHYLRILAADDRSIRTIWDETAAHKGPAVVIWERGLTEPRKLAYYAHIPLIRLEATTPLRPRAPLYTKWDSARLLEQRSATAPLAVKLEAGSRLLWMVKPNTPLAAELQRVFLGRQVGDVFVTDLPMEPGERKLGDFSFVWSD